MTMRMRQLLWSGITLAVGTGGLMAGDDRREVIASSNSSGASLGAPVSGPVIKVRAQMADKPIVAPSTAPPPLNTDASPILPYPNAMPSFGQMPPAGQSTSSGQMPPAGQVPYPQLPPGATIIPGPTTAMPLSAPVPDGGPCLNCNTGAFNPAMAPLPGGIFNWAPVANNHRWYVSGDYLYWWVRDSGLPPLVTTGTPLVAGVTESGPLDRNIDPNTRVLFGNAPVDNQGRSGAKFEVGRWFGECRPWAIEFGGFFLGDRSTSFHVDSNQVSPLSRPIIIANIPREGVDNVSNPGLIAGAIDINGNSSFYGANLDWRRRLWSNCGYNVDMVAGFRYLNLDEDLNITERSIITANGVVAPNLNNAPLPFGLQSIISDRFKVDNDFYGGMIGLKSTWNINRFSLDLGTKVSIGNTHERVNIEGNQLIIYPDGRQFPFNGGLLARPSNIGSFSRNKFAVVPEVNFNVGYQATQHLKFMVGYDFLYWSNVLRVGDQIDRQVNINGIPYFPQTGVRGNTDPVTGGAIPAGPARPAVLFKDTDFWAQGVSVGVQWTW